MLSVVILVFLALTCEAHCIWLSRKCGASRGAISEKKSIAVACASPPSKRMLNHVVDIILQRSLKFSAGEEFFFQALNGDDFILPGGFYVQNNRANAAPLYGRLYDDMGLLCCNRQSLKLSI